MKRGKLLIALMILMLSLLLPHMAYPSEIEFPLLQSFSYFPYWDNSSVEKGKFSTSMEMHYSNFFMHNHERTTFNDFELFTTTLGARYGLGGGRVVELFTRYSTIFGGSLDKFIEDFHRTFNLPNNNRHKFSRNDVRYWYGHHFSYEGSQNALSPLILSYLQPLLKSPQWQIKARLAIGIPLSKKPGFSSDKPFLSAGIISTYEKNWFRMELSNYISFVKLPSWLEGEEIRSTLWFSQIEVHAFRFIAGFSFRNSVFNSGDVSDNAYQIHIGYRISSHLDFIIQEDFAPFNTTPDIGFNLRYRF